MKLDLQSSEHLKGSLRGPTKGSHQGSLRPELPGHQGQLPGHLLELRDHMDHRGHVIHRDLATIGGRGDVDLESIG